MPDNLSNNKRIAKNTIFLYIRSVFLLLIALYTSRITLQVLGVEDYGIYQVVGGVVSMFAMLSNTLSAASQRFITYALGEDDQTKVYNVFSTCVSLHFVMGTLVVLILEVLGVWFLYNKLNIPYERMSTALIVMQFSIATFFVNVISVPYNAAIIAHEKMSAFAYISIIDGILKLLSVALLFYIEWDKLLLYSLFHFAIAITIRFIYTLYSSRHFEETRKIKLKIDTTQFKQMFAFSGWNLIGSSALVLRNQGIDILLNLYFGVTVNAAKGICNQVQNAVHQLVGNFTVSVNPQLTQSIARKDYLRAHSLIFHGGKMAFMLMCVIAVPFIVSCEPILDLWLTEVPEYTVEMVIITFVYLLTDTLSRFLINSVLAYGEIRNFQIILGGIKLMAIPLTWVFIKLGGSPYSGVIVNALLQFICFAGELYYSNKYVGTDKIMYLRRVFAPCWSTFLLALIISLIFSLYVSNMFVQICISFVMTFTCITIVGLDKTEKMMARSVIAKVCSRK